MTVFELKICCLPRVQLWMPGEICLIVSRSSSRIGSRMARIATRQLPNIWSGRHFFDTKSVCCECCCWNRLTSDPSYQKILGDLMNSNLLGLWLVSSHGHTILTKSLRFFFVLLFTRELLLAVNERKILTRSPFGGRAQRWVAPRFTVSAASTSAAGYRQFRQNTDSAQLGQQSFLAGGDECERPLPLPKMQISRRQPRARTPSSVTLKRPASRSIKTRWNHTMIHHFRLFKD